jgi:RNA polymerase sigma factor (sigma-70 family)
MMEAYMRERFPSIEPDDVIQETLIALIESFPVYHYSPEEKGSFHNYLTGILRNKALRQINRDNRRAAVAQSAAKEMKSGMAFKSPSDKEALQRDIFEIALRQLLADETVHARTREVFRRVAVNGEKPEDVASDFGITRNAVYQMKDRMMTRLREFVAALEKVEARSNA